MEDYQKLLQMIEDLKKTVTEQQIKIQELEEKVEEMHVEYRNEHDPYFYD